LYNRSYEGGTNNDRLEFDGLGFYKLKHNEIYSLVTFCVMNAERPTLHVLFTCKLHCESFQELITNIYKQLTLA